MDKLQCRHKDPACLRKFSGKQATRNRARHEREKKHDCGEGECGACSRRTEWKCETCGRVFGRKAYYTNHAAKCSSQRSASQQRTEVVPTFTSVMTSSTPTTSASLEKIHPQESLLLPISQTSSLTHQTNEDRSLEFYSGELIIEESYPTDISVTALEYPAYNSNAILLSTRSASTDSLTS